MKTIALTISLLTMLAALLGAAVACRAGDTGRQVAIVGSPGVKARLTVTVADTEQARQRGLMGRTTLGPDDGMLFVFDQPDRVPFWMKDTSLPLAIAFIAGSGEIVGLDEMAPLSTDLHAAGPPYQFALEAPGGYFAAHGVNVGDTIQLVDPAGRLRPLRDLLPRPPTSSPTAVP